MQHGETSRRPAPRRPSHASLAHLGYAACYAWTFCTSSIYEFGGGPAASAFAASVLPGVAACAAALALTHSPRGSRALRRFMRMPIAAFLASLGTLLGIMPEFASVPGLPQAGMACAGLFFLFVLAQWGLAYARLDGRGLLGMASASALVAAAVCVAVSAMPLSAAAFTCALLPLASYVCLRACDTGEEPRADGGAGVASEPQVTGHNRQEAPGENSAAAVDFSGAAGHGGGPMRPVREGRSAGAGDQAVGDAPCGAGAAAVHPAHQDRAANASRSTADNAAGAAGSRRPYRADGRRGWAALPWRTFAGLFAIFFAYNGVLSTRAIHESWLGSADLRFLVLPALLAAAGVVAARLSRAQRPSFAGKVALVAVSAPFMLASYAVQVTPALAFADGLAMYTATWVVLVAAMQGCRDDGLRAFYLGWLAQTLGGALSYPLAPLAGLSDTLYTFLMLAFLIVSGVELFSGERSSGEAGAGTSGGIAPTWANDGADAHGNLAPACSDDGRGAGRAPASAWSGSGADSIGTAGANDPHPASSPAAQPDPAGEFCALHDLSSRETEVFRLWITGHGVRDISAKLCMSESTAKTHIRHIYDKCEVYGKARLLEAYETWADNRDA